MYPATHIGHLGSRTSVALGMTQPAISPLRRATLQHVVLMIAPRLSRIHIRTTLLLPPALLRTLANTVYPHPQIRPRHSGRDNAPTPCRRAGCLRRDPWEPGPTVCT